VQGVQVTVGLGLGQPGLGNVERIVFMANSQCSATVVSGRVLRRYQGTRTADLTIATP